MWYESMSLCWKTPTVKCNSSSTEFSRVDNRRPGKRKNSGSTGLSLDIKNMNPQKSAGEHMVNAWGLLFKIFCHWFPGYICFGKNTMKEKFCVFSQNVRSLKKNVNLLVESLVENKLSPSVFALNEFWHSDDISFVKLSGYQEFSASNHKTKASGVALFFDQKIQVQLQDIKNIFSFDILVVDRFLTSSQKFSVIAIYISPSNSSETYLQYSEKLLETNHVSHPCVVVGDMNIDSLKQSANSWAYLFSFLSFGFK